MNVIKEIMAVIEHCTVPFCRLYSSLPVFFFFFFFFFFDVLSPGRVSRTERHTED